MTLWGVQALMPSDSENGLNDKKYDNTTTIVALVLYYREACVEVMTWFLYTQNRYMHVPSSYYIPTIYTPTHEQYTGMWGCVFFRELFENW